MLPAAPLKSPIVRFPLAPLMSKTAVEELTSTAAFAAKVPPFVKLRVPELIVVTPV
jgi:hypothetical protein